MKLKSVMLATIATLELLNLLKMVNNVRRVITALQELSFQLLALRENIRFLELDLKTTVEIVGLGSIAFATLNLMQLLNVPQDITALQVWKNLFLALLELTMLILSPRV